MNAVLHQPGPGPAVDVVAVEASLEKLVSAAAEAIWAEVPAYAASPDDQLRDDVTAHVRSIFLTFLAGLRTGQPARRADFAASREQAARRVVQGITLADFLQAFRIGQLTLWQGVLDAAGDDPVARDAALSIVAHIMQIVELGSTIRATACPRPAPSPPSTGWTGPAAPARSACPSGACRSGSSGTTGRRPETVSQGRSRSAATT